MKLDILKLLQKVTLIPLTKNQNVITCKDNEGTKYYCFYSYQTLIAIYSECELLVSRNYWDYSKTTMKWFNYFLNKYTSFYFVPEGFKHNFTKAIMANDKITQF